MLLLFLKRMSNYRLISLLTNVTLLLKFLIKNVLEHVYNVLNDHHVINTLQSGFDPEDSTVNQLVDLYNTFCWVLAYTL